MKPDTETYDTLSITVTAIVAIVAVTLMVLNLSPGAVPHHAPSPQENSGGRAIDYATDCVPLTTQYSDRWLDFNEDGIIDYYDYQDVLAGTIDCTTHQCDLTNDGLIDARDEGAFNNMVRRLYDYDNDGQLTRDDLLLLRHVMDGTASCDTNHICDLNHDGKLCADDLTHYTTLLYNYDNPNLVGEASFILEIEGVSRALPKKKKSNGIPK